VYLLWWVQHKHISPAIVAAILAAGDLAVTVLEAPTGWLADRYGHRRSLMLGSAVQVVAMLFCWLGEGVAGLLTASLLVALGDAFRSGADQALLYRSCVALERTRDFQRIEATTKSVELIALVALLLVGGGIAAAGSFEAAWIVECALSAAGLVIAWTLVEPPPAVGR
jgi:MFS family permease